MWPRPVFLFLNLACLFWIALQAFFLVRSCRLPICQAIQSHLDGDREDGVGARNEAVAALSQANVGTSGGNHSLGRNASTRRQGPARSPRFLAREVAETAGCEARARWLAAAERNRRGPPRISELPRGLPFHCFTAQRICLHNNELVAMPSQNVELLNQSSTLPDMSDLAVFGKIQIPSQLPGYWDIIPGVTSVVSPTPVRPVARFFETAPLDQARMLDITPILVYTSYPFNFGDSMGPYFMHSWVQALEKHEELRRLPVIMALPHGFALPPYFRLAENLGPPIEAFGTVARECPAGPLCFKTLIGCGGIMKRPWWKNIADDKGAAWRRFRATTVRNLCASIAGIGGGSQTQTAAGAPGKRKKLVVGFTWRDSGRNILNVGSMMDSCANHNPRQAGLDLECRIVKLGDVMQDVCIMQELDVLVGLHGAQLLTGLFMRPGSSLVEVRAKGFYSVDSSGRQLQIDSWMNAIRHKFMMTNNTWHWLYGVETGHVYPIPRPPNILGLPARDANVELSWSRLLCMLELIASVADREAYDRLCPFVNVGCL